MEACESPPTPTSEGRAAAHISSGWPVARPSKVERAFGLSVTEFECATCAFFLEIGSALRDEIGPACPGECHRNAPQVGSVVGIDTTARENPDEDADAEWPKVWEHDFCGQHSAVGGPEWTEYLSDRRIIAKWLAEAGAS